MPVVLKLSLEYFRAYSTMISSNFPFYAILLAIIQYRTMCMTLLLPLRFIDSLNEVLPRLPNIILVQGRPSLQISFSPAAYFSRGIIARVAAMVSGPSNMM